LHLLVDDPVFEEDGCAEDYHSESVLVLKGLDNARGLPSLQDDRFLYLIQIIISVACSYVGDGLLPS
jgi:hypothetical protein